MIKVLVVCSGNICRSPLAAALVRERGGARGLQLEVQSAGTLGLVGRPAHPKSLRVSHEIGLLFDHKSQALTEELAKWADHILTMELHHGVWISENTPSGVNKVIGLGGLIGKAAIDDPVDTWFLGTYRRTRDELIVAVDRFLDHLERLEKQMP